MKTDSKKDTVVAALIKLANDAEYNEGDQLPPERELAKRFGVGRNIVREAMISLESMGIIEKKERLGVFLKHIDSDEVKMNLEYMQLPPAEFTRLQMEVRMFVSVPAVELAAARRTDEDLKKLWECYHEFANSPISTAEEEIISSKWESLLHHLETEAAHNPILSRINESISGLLDRNHSFAHHHALRDTPGWFEHIRDQHYKIIQAIEDGDPVVAGSTMKMHIMESYDAVKKNSSQLKSGPKIYWELSGNSMM